MAFIILGCVCSFISILEVQTNDEFLKLDAEQVAVTEDIRWGWRGEGMGREGRGGVGRRGYQLFPYIFKLWAESSELSPKAGRVF